MKKQLTLAVLTAVGVAALGGAQPAAAQDIINLEGVVVTDVRDRGILPGGYADMNWIKMSNSVALKMRAQEARKRKSPAPMRISIK